MTRIAAFTKYGDLAASTRQRFEIYRRYLEAEGIGLDLFPLLDNDYLRRLYAGRRNGSASILRRYAGRVSSIMRQRGASMFWVHCDIFPYAPSLVDHLLLMPGKPVVFDYDDAVFHTYDLHRSRLVRRFLGHKIDRLMARSVLVMAGNPYLAERARMAGAARVAIVPTVVDVEAYDATPLSADDGMPRIGWIGTPSTWQQYMQPMLPMLSALARENRAKLRAVGSGATGTPELEALPWTEAGESRMIQTMDIGLMPLDDTPWSRGKCGYKIIQYMACGLPVVASPVGVNAEIVEDGVTGFLASTEVEWREAITTLLHDPELRHRMGAAGRKRMEERYSLQVWGPRVAELLRSVART